MNKYDANELREIYRRCDVSNNGTESPLGEEEFVQLITSREKSIKEQAEKAFGGCRNCYGKGYATYIDGTTAYADFGDELGGDYSRHTDKLEMRFCECSRGQQLEHLVTVLHSTNNSLEEK